MEIRRRERSRGLFMSKDIIFEISLRLPVKSLMRFKATCKLWNSIISDDPNFAELHHRERIQKQRLIFWECRLTWEHWIYNVLDNGAKAEKSQHLRVKYPYGPMVTRFAHSSGALLLFKTKNPRDTRNTHTLFVYDSISGNQILLPGLPMSSDLRSFLMYDVSTKMYKVLVYANVIQNSKLVDCCRITIFCNKTMKSENVWRMTPAPAGRRFNLTSNTSIKGIMYWLVSKPIPLYPMAREKFIKPFDIAEEKFLNTIKCPDKISTLQTPFKKYSLLEMRGVLGFMSMIFDEFQIWVLTDSDNSSWDLLHKINVETMFDILYNFHLQVVFVLEKINNILPTILLSYRNKYYWFEMDGKKVKEMNVAELGGYSNGCISAWIP